MLVMDQIECLDVISISRGFVVTRETPKRRTVEVFASATVETYSHTKSHPYQTYGKLEGLLIANGHSQAMVLQ
jgi:hypothetical protein